MANSFVVGMFGTSLIGFSGNARGVPAESTTLGFDSTVAGIIPLPSGPVQGRCLPVAGTTGRGSFVQAITHLTKTSASGNAEPPCRPRKIGGGCFIKLRENPL